jgi:hypothetical protein
MVDRREAFFEKSACKVEMKRSKKLRGAFQLFFFTVRKKLVSKLLVHRKMPHPPKAILKMSTWIFSAQQ